MRVGTEKADGKTYLRLLKAMLSWEGSPLSFLLRDWGLDGAREHSAELTWHGMQPSSSSLSMQRVPAWRHARQGGKGRPL
jgi:hypothetical protein